MNPDSLHDEGRGHPPAEHPSPPRKGFVRLAGRPLRRMYDWVLSLAETPYGPAALFALAFSEATFFPIPPDVLLIALALGAAGRSFRFAAICTLGSVLGAAAGYGIGCAAAPFAKSLILGTAGGRFYYEVANAFGENAFPAIALAGFTPIPFKVFTLAAGVFHEHVGFLTLVSASLVSRSLRFFLVGGLIFFFGPSVKRFIDRYFELAALILGLLVIVGFLLLGGAGRGKAGIYDKAPVLIAELSHPDPVLRAAALEELENAARDLGRPAPFGFDPDKSPSENARAIRKWNEWWEGASREIQAAEKFR